MRRESTRGLRVLAVCAALMAVGAPAARAQSLADLFGAKKPSRPATEYKVAVRDGVKLATDVTLPEGPGPWPVILTRTPYGKSRGAMINAGIDFVAHGYAAVVQDCRGRYQSEGTFGTFEHEPTDGFDTIAWIAQQPWCDGNVGMFGVSAMGITANFAAMTAPPNLKCTFVCVAHGCDFRYGSFPGGVFLQDLNERWFQTIGAPLAPAPKPRIGVYNDEYARRDMRNHYANVRVPTFNVAGWYDIFCESGAENFAGLNRAGSGAAKGNQRLVIGAFGHFPINGKLKYPADAARLKTELVVPWFDHWLKGKGSGVLAGPPVRYFLMGDPFDKSAPGNEWRTAEDWPPPADEMALYFQEGGRLSKAPPDEPGSETYAYDPRSPVPTVGGNNLFSARGPMDQRAVGDRTDVIKYVSEPLAEPLAVVGRVFAELFVSTDAPDTDFMVKLVDIYPDGYEALMLDQAHRLRYHQGLDQPQRIKPNEVYPLRINLWSTALVFNRGHRIGVFVSSSNAPRFEPHTNTWEPVESYDQAVVAKNTIHRAPGKASRVLLPVAQNAGVTQTNGSAAARAGDD